MLVPLLNSLDGKHVLQLEIKHITVYFYSRGLNEEGYFPNDLFEIHQEIVDNDSCYLNWGGDITDRMLCAAVENEVDSCSGKLVYCLSIDIIYTYFFIIFFTQVILVRHTERNVLYKLHLFFSCLCLKGGAVLQFGCLQVGIISFGSNICGYPIPSVFTRIENPLIRGFIRYYARV